MRTSLVRMLVWYTSRFGELAASRSVVSGMLASSVSVSVVPAAAPVKPRPPRLAPPAPSRCVTGAADGSGHSAYGVGLDALQARKTVAPLVTVATAPATVTCVASGMLVM